MSAPAARDSGQAPALTVVIPAYNEAANVEPVVAETLEVLRGTPWLDGFELVLVDDGSRDGTSEVMDRLAAAHPEIVVVHHETNGGLGAALKTGFQRSRGLAVTFISADGELGVDQPLRLLREMGDRDLMLSGRVRDVSAGRRVLTWGLNWVSRTLLGFWPDDTVGAYVVRGDVLRTIPLMSDTGLVNLEILLHCGAHRLKIAVSGVTQVRPRLSGASKVTNFRTALRTFVEMVKLRVKLRRR